MMVQINDEHLAFMYEARDAFSHNDIFETYMNRVDFDLIALRFGIDRDCILIYELGNEVANFVQQMKPAPRPRKEVMKFAYGMEKQLKANEHKGGWQQEHHQDLTAFMFHNIEKLRNELFKIGEERDKREISIRCANIANFAMMVADNEGDHL